jgi:hypothetical protein
LENGKSYKVFSLPSSASHHEKANNCLNIKEENLHFYFWIALVVRWESLQMEFAKMFFLLLLQAKSVFL